MLIAVLYILKILLTILIGTIVFILALIGIILFVPIQYEVCGEKQEEILIYAKASWLFQIIKVSFTYQNEVKFCLKVFWKTLFSNPEEEQSQNQNFKNKNGEEKDPITTDHPNKENKKFKHIIIDDIETKQINKNHVKKIKIERHKKKNKKKIKKSKEDTLTRIKSYLTDEENKGVLKFVFSQMIKIFRVFLPRTFNLHIKFGTNDPAITGYILGIGSIFYTFTGDSMSIEPNFYKKELKGNFDLKGKVYIFIMLFYALKIILDKRVRKLISEFNI